MVNLIGNQSQCILVQTSLRINDNDITYLKVRMVLKNQNTIHCFQMKKERLKIEKNSLDIPFKI